jgi:hypothetical protein
VRRRVIPPYWGFPKSRDCIQNLRWHDVRVILSWKAESHKKYFRKNPAVAPIRTAVIAGLILLSSGAERSPSADARPLARQDWESQNQTWRGVHL